MRRKIYMADFAKGPVVVLGPEDGPSFWQPLPSTGYIINKLTPYNSPYDNFAMGLQVLAPGAHIRRHAHERQHEVLFCYQGTGIAEVGSERHEVAPETMILVGRGVQHKVTNTGASQMRLLWMTGSALSVDPANPARRHRHRSSGPPTSPRSRRSNASSAPRRADAAPFPAVMRDQGLQLLDICAGDTKSTAVIDAQLVVLPVIAAVPVALPVAWIVGAFTSSDVPPTGAGSGTPAPGTADIVAATGLANPAALALLPVPDATGAGAGAPYIAGLD
jgi:mannose-6-phosphate isomerase-like protein (cupin superfamily)